MVEAAGTAIGTRLATLLFDAGCRPDAGAVAHVVDALAHTSLVESAPGPAADGAGWVELLRDGLTFDLSGLAPAQPAPLPDIAHSFGLEAALDPAGCEALSLAPGPHLAGAGHLLPVVRVAAALLAGLVGLPGLKGVVWCPARTLVSPSWFRRAVEAWLGGGPFPALALSAIVRGPDGVMRSEGLAFLTGQEFRLVPASGAPPEAAGRMAMRLSDWLVAHGRVESAREVILAGTGAVWLDPVAPGLVEARCA